MNKNIVLFMLGLCFFAACASTGSKSNIKVLETVPNISEPSWVKTSDEYWERRGIYYYRGISEGLTNLEAAKRAATASAKTNLAEQVKSTIRVEFSKALEAGNYDDTTGGYLKDIFFSAVDNLTLSGVAQKESYVQHILESNGINEKLYYRAYALATVSVEDYNKLVKSAFSKTNAQVAANKSAKELAKETEERFWNAQEKEN